MNPDAIRQELSRRYAGDQQGFLVAEARLILRGKLPGELTDIHRDALVAANRRVIGPNIYTDEAPF